MPASAWAAGAAVEHQARIRMFAVEAAIGAPSGQGAAVRGGCTGRFLSVGKGRSSGAADEPPAAARSDPQAGAGAAAGPPPEVEMVAHWR